jgi:valyl-tRNA synthetase
LYVDNTLVDMTFGTGAVKVTPAHDPNDNLCGKRNNLDTIIIFTEEGKMNNNCGEFTGIIIYI